MGKVDRRVSIVINMSEEQLRALIQEEVRIALNATLDAEAQESLEVIEKASETISVRLGNPSAASRIPTVPFPEITAEDVQARIEELDGGTYHYGRAMEEDEGAYPGEEIEAVAPVSRAYKHFSATEIGKIRKLVAFFELSLEQALRDHIHLMRDLPPLARHLEKIGPSWQWEALVAQVDTVAPEHGLVWDAGLDLVVEEEGEGRR